MNIHHGKPSRPQTDGLREASEKQTLVQNARSIVEAWLAKHPEQRRRPVPQEPTPEPSWKLRRARIKLGLEKGDE